MGVCCIGCDWRCRSQTVCKSDLLKNIPLVLFLNKCDELEHKLALGLRVEDFVQLGAKGSKREAGNDVESVKHCECMRLLPSPTPTPRFLIWALLSQSAKTIGRGPRVIKRPDLTNRGIETVACPVLCPCDMRASDGQTGKETGSLALLTCEGAKGRIISLNTRRIQNSEGKGENSDARSLSMGTGRL